MKFDLKKELKKILISPESTVKDVIENLNETQLKISIVIDKNDKLIGTIVDGDIRRGLLNGINLKDKINKIIQKNPIVVSTKIKENEALTIMRENFLQHIPIINEVKKPIGLFTLEETMSPVKRDNKIIIMAGGFGKRMLPLTKSMPKALIKVFGKPMLEHVILKARQCGFRNFILSINYLGQMIKENFLEGEKLDVKIDYLEETKPLGTAGSLCYLKNLKNETILVTNCDVISDIDYANALDYHKKNSADATMVVRRYETQNPFGVILTQKNNFISYHEKPIKQENINAGIYILESNMLKFLEDEKYINMPEFFSILTKKEKKVIVYPIYESWHDLGQKHINMENK